MTLKNTWRSYTQSCFPKGFTLIELLVVVLIIGILAAVAVPQYQKAVEKSRYASLKNLTNSIANAQEIYYLANNIYANNFRELDLDLPSGKLNTSSDSNYQYNWGRCQIFAQEAVRCSGFKMGYERRFIYSKTQPNRTKCYAYTENMQSPQVKICIQETNNTSYEAPSGERRFTYKK